MNQPKTIAIILAFACIYITWGSTYLAIAITLKDMPPFFMSALRFLTAAGLLLVWCIYKREKLPLAAEIKKSALVAVPMLAGATAAIAWAEQHISSGMAAITTTTLPFWFLLLDKKQWKVYFSSKWIITGLATGFIGAVMLLAFRPLGHSTASAGMQLLSIAVLIVGCGILWTSGSLFSKYHPSKLSPALNTCIQLFIAGLISLLISFCTEPIKNVYFSHFHSSTWTALAYLVVMGNIVAYMAYIWLLKVKPPAIVSTYAYVSPVIAVILGWLVAGDTIGLMQVIAFIIILAGLLLINMPKYRQFFKTTHSPSFKISKGKTAIACLLCFLAVPVYSQTLQPADTTKKELKWKHRVILIQPLEANDHHYNELKLDEMILPPGSTDTIKHQHFAQLTGYIAEGTVVSKMKNKTAQTFTAGQAFYEYPGEVHEYLKNANPDTQAKIILYYLYKKEAVLYKKLAVQ